MWQVLILSGDNNDNRRAKDFFSNQEDERCYLIKKPAFLFECGAQAKKYCCIIYVLVFLLHVHFVNNTATNIENSQACINLRLIVL